MILTGPWRNAIAFLVAPACLLGVILVRFATSWTPVMIGLAILFVAAVAWPLADYAAHGRHSRHYRKFAHLHGWEYFPQSTAYNTRFDGYPFGIGVEQYQVDVVSGRLNGAQCATFLHRFTGDEVNLGSHRLFQVTLVEIPVRLPRLDILPENTATRVMSQIGGFDISTESHEFNRRWRVRTSDRRYAFDVLDPRMVERLTWDDTHDMSIRIDGGAIMMWQHGRFTTDDLAHRLGVLTAIARRIPKHVVRDFQDRGLGVEQPTYEPPTTAPAWATTPWVLTSGQYTGIEATLPERPQYVSTTASGLGVLGWALDWSGLWDD